MRAFLTVALLAVGCHGHVEPALVARDTVVTVDKTFVATAVVMRAVRPQLSDAQWQSWVAFEQRFKTSFHAARVLYDEALDAQLAALDAGVVGGDAALKAAESVLANLGSQLGYWQGVAAQLSHPDGGVL